MDNSYEFMSYINTPVGKRSLNFDNENPEIYELFKKCAYKAQKAGHKKYSANGIFEYIRWKLIVEKKHEYKMNNNYRAYYARKLMNEDDNFIGFFEIRREK